MDKLRSRKLKRSVPCVIQLMSIRPEIRIQNSCLTVQGFFNDFFLGRMQAASMEGMLVSFLCHTLAGMSQYL
jgi:hypothetical protein